MGGKINIYPGRKHIWGERVAKIGLFTEAAFLQEENSPRAITLIRAGKIGFSPIYLPAQAGQLFRDKAWNTKLMHWDKRDKKMAPVATVGTIYGCYIIQTEFSRLRPKRIIRVECLNFCSTTIEASILVSENHWYTNCSVNLRSGGRLDSFMAILWEIRDSPFTVKAKCRYSFIATGQIILEIKGDTKLHPV